jgi:hypothetical protein
MNNLSALLYTALNYTTVVTYVELIFMIIHAPMEFLGNGFRCVHYKVGLNEMKIRSRKAVRWLSQSNLLHYLVILILEEKRRKERKKSKLRS